MSDIPETPFVPPAPSRLNPGLDFAQKSDALAAFYPTLVAFIAAALAWMADAMQQVAASLAIGSFPSLTGHARKFFRVNSAGTLAEFVAPADCLEDTSIASLTRASGSATMLASLNWNLMRGAINFGSSAAWVNTASNNGITATKLRVGFDPMNGPYVDYTVSGTATAAATITLDDPVQSRWPAANSEVFTASFWGQIIDGTPPLSTGLNGLQPRIFEEAAPSTHVIAASGATMVNSGTPTLTSVTRTISELATNQVRMGVTVRVVNGQTVNYTVRIWGVRLERGSVRTNGLIREYTSHDVAPVLRAAAVARATTTASVVALGSNAAHIIPADGTVPQSTEGVQILSCPYTVRSPTSRLRVTLTVECATTNLAASAYVVVPLFNNLQSSALKVLAIATSSANAAQSGMLVHEFAHGQAADTVITFSARLGVQSSSYNAAVNSNASGSPTFPFGQDMHAVTITIEEVAQ